MKDTIDSATTVNDESFWKKNAKDVPADQVSSKYVHIPPSFSVSEDVFYVALFS